MADGNEDRHVLEAFVVDNRELEQLEDLLAEFNLFEAIGVVGQELKHSNFLAFLLDPTAPHGLGEVFAKRLFKRILAQAENPPFSPIEVDVLDLREAEVRREWRNIDLLIVSPENRFVCVIENKTKTSEHSNQLMRYKRIVDTEFEGFRQLYLYLTPGGDPPSDDAYVSVGYGTVVSVAHDLADVCASTLGPDLKTTIDHYCKMVRRRIMADSEIQRLCEKIHHQHKRALELLVKYKPDLQSDIACFLKALHADACAQHDLTEIHWNGTNNIAFGMLLLDDIAQRAMSLGWGVNERILDFDLRNHDSLLEIRLRILPGMPGDEGLRRALYEFAQSQPTVFRPHRRLIAHTPIFSRAMVRPKDLQGAAFESVRAKIERSWEIFLHEDLPTLSAALQDFEIPAPVRASTPPAA